jgi:hypothetical protein
VSSDIDSKPAANITGPRVSEQFVSWVQAAAEANEGTRSFDVAASQLDRILSETDLDSIMDADEEGTRQLRDLVGAELRIPAPGFPECVHKSAEKFNSPLGVYIQFNAIALSSLPKLGIAEGDELLVSTGAPLVIGKLRSMEANGFLPYDFLVVGIEAPNGTVLKLRRMPARKA